MVRELLLDLLDPLKHPVPTGFQFCSHQAILRVRCIILSECTVSRILRRLQITAERIANLIPLTHRLPGGGFSGGEKETEGANSIDPIMN